MPELHRPSGTATVSPLTPPATGLHRLSERKRTPVGIAWAGLCIGLLAMVALVVFVLQNTHGVQVSFLWMRGSLPLASALLTAVAAAVVAIATVGVARRAPATPPEPASLSSSGKVIAAKPFGRFGG